MAVFDGISRSSNKRQSEVAQKKYENIQRLESNFGLTPEERSRWGRIRISYGVSICLWGFNRSIPHKILYYLKSITSGIVKHKLANQWPPRSGLVLLPEVL